MSSELARPGISTQRSSYAVRRRRLHSWSFAWFCRAFSVLLAIGACQLAWNAVVPAAQAGEWKSLLEWLLVFLATALVAAYLWRRPKPIYATVAGLEVGRGSKRRLIPWSRVLDVREMPSVRFSAFSRPSMWQVDLDHDQRFDFCGTPDARAIVIEFIERAERPVQ